MRFRTSLRYRVTLAFALLGMLVSLCLAGALYVLTIDMEERLIAETLSAELEDYSARYEANPNTSPPASTTIQTYVVVPGDKRVPKPLRALTAGLHQLRLNHRDYYAEVRVGVDRSFIVLYDDKQIRHRENMFLLFLGIGVFVMTLFSALIGFWLAGRVIAPVRELVARVAGLGPEVRPALRVDFPGDEVGILAREFDAYRCRLAAFVEREQAFSTDVSHELRTPLAVIEGASEVLLDDPRLSEGQCARVERIARSAREMTALVTALLLLAREENDKASKSGCAVDDILQQVVDSHRHLLQHKPVDLRLDILANQILPVECTLLRVVLANLIRNALNYTERGFVTICLDEKGVSVTDTGIGIPKAQIEWIFDRFYKGSAHGEGIGLSLVKRICQRYGWKIEINSHKDQGTVFRLSF